PRSHLADRGAQPGPRIGRHGAQKLWRRGRAQRTGGPPASRAHGRLLVQRAPGAAIGAAPEPAWLHMTARLADKLTARKLGHTRIVPGGSDSGSPRPSSLKPQASSRKPAQNLTAR